MKTSNWFYGNDFRVIILYKCDWFILETGLGFGDGDGGCKEGWGIGQWYGDGESSESIGHGIGEGYGDGQINGTGVGSGDGFGYGNE
jgi:hypothetical protein